MDEVDREIERGDVLQWAPLEGMLEQWAVHHADDEAQAEEHDPVGVPDKEWSDGWGMSAEERIDHALKASGVEGDRKKRKEKKGECLQ